MISYKDMTFCAHDTCTKFQSCTRALTEQVLIDAQRWMKDAPIAQYVDKPNCYVKPVCDICGCKLDDNHYDELCYDCARDTYT